MPQGRVVDPDGHQSPPGDTWGYIARNDKDWPQNPNHEKPDKRKTIPFYNPKEGKKYRWEDGAGVKFKVKYARLTLDDGATFLAGKIGIAVEVNDDPH